MNKTQAIQALRDGKKIYRADGDGEEYFYLRPNGTLCNNIGSTICSSINPLEGAIMWNLEVEWREWFSRARLQDYVIYLDKQVQRLRELVQGIPTKNILDGIPYRKTPKGQEPGRIHASTFCGVDSFQAEMIMLRLMDHLNELNLHEYGTEDIELSKDDRQKIVRKFIRKLELDHEFFCGSGSVETALPKLHGRQLINRPIGMTQELVAGIINEFIHFAGEEKDIHPMKAENHDYNFLRPVEQTALIEDFFKATYESEKDVTEIPVPVYAPIASE